MIRMATYYTAIKPFGSDDMKRQLQGIGIILFSIMMILGIGDEPVFDLSLSFSHIFMAVGVFGFGWMFTK